MSIRGNILSKIRERVLQVPELHEERVRIGLVPISQISSGPVFLIQPSADRGRLDDCDRTTRTLDVVTGLLMRLDPNKSDAQILQMEDQYAAIHAKLESLVLDNCDGLAISMNEGPSGVLPGGFDDLDNVAYIGCDWELAYNRQLATES